MEPLILHKDKEKDNNNIPIHNRPLDNHNYDNYAVAPQSNLPNKKYRLPLGLIAIVIIVSGLGYVAMNFGELMPVNTVENSSVKPSDGYQAVFLSNGNVFFGKLVLNEDWVVLSDVFYPQADQDLAGNDKSNLYIVKLGSELHGPEDTMYIKPEAVLYWEEIAGDSRVLDAINKYKTKK